MTDIDQEWSAAGLVLGLIGGTAQMTDIPGARPRTPDFEITRSGGGTIALEVTATTVNNVASTWNEIHKESWSSDTLTSNWSVSLRAPERSSFPVRVKGLAEKIASHLSVLELAGVDRFGPHDGVHGSTQERAATRYLHELGVVQGCALTKPHTGEPAEIAVGTVGASSGPWVDLVNSAVEREAEANREKLVNAPADERHLFVWVDRTDPNCQAGISLELIPATPPRLPSGIDAVWIAPWLPESGSTVPTSTLWRSEAGEHWESMPVRYIDPRVS